MDPCPLSENLLNPNPESYPKHFLRRYSTWIHKVYNGICIYICIYIQMYVCSRHNVAPSCRTTYDAMLPWRKHGIWLMVIHPAGFPNHCCIEAPINQWIDYHPGKAWSQIILGGAGQVWFSGYNHNEFTSISWDTVWGPYNDIMVMWQLMGGAAPLSEVEPVIFHFNGRSSPWYK